VEAEEVRNQAQAETVQRCRSGFKKGQSHALALAESQRGLLAHQTARRVTRNNLRAKPYSLESQGQVEKEHSKPGLNLDRQAASIDKGNDAGGIKTGAQMVVAESARLYD